MKKILTILFLIASFLAISGLPPTTSRKSGDASDKTTFNYHFPNFTGTRTGVTTTFDVLQTAGGGTGSTNLGTGVLRSTSGAIATGTVNLALSTDVEGILPIANGGTNSANLGTGFIVGSSGVLTATPSISLVTDVSNILPITSGGTGATTQPLAAINILPSGANSGDRLTWSGTNWVSLPAQISVGSVSIYYLNNNATFADNLTLENDATELVEVPILRATTVANSPFLFDRFIGPEIGNTTIQAGTWNFHMYGLTNSNSGSEIQFRINKRVAKTGCTGTWSGAGATRTFDITNDGGGACVFAAGDVGSASGNFAERTNARLIETGSLVQDATSQTGWITTYASPTQAVITLTDSAFINPAPNTTLNAFYDFLFRSTTGTLSTTQTHYDVDTTQPAFSINTTDRLVFAVFGWSSANRNITLYYGGTSRYTRFESPILTNHNDLTGLNLNGYKHLTADEYTKVSSATGTGKLVSASDTVNVLTSSTSAQLGSLISDETGNAGGTGLAVFSASPAFSGVLSVGSEALGGGLVTNSTLGSDTFIDATHMVSTNWTLNTGWESTNDAGTQLNHNAAGTGTAIFNTLLPTSGLLYKVSFSVNATVTGGFGLSYAGIVGSGGTVNPAINTPTVYSFYVRAVSAGALSFTPVTTARFTISAISIQLVTAGTGDLTVYGDHYLAGKLMAVGATNGLTMAHNGVAYFPSALVLSGAIGTATTITSTGLHTNTQTTTTTSLPGLTFTTSASLVGTPVRTSPSLRFSGTAWNTTPTAASKINAIDIYSLPVSGGTTSNSLVFANATLDGSANTSALMSLSSEGGLTVGDSTSSSIFSGTVTIATANTTILTAATVTVSGILSAGSQAIGAASPNTSSILDIVSTTRGLNFPRMTTAQKNAIATAGISGLVVYDGTLNALSTFNGSVWDTAIPSASAISAYDINWATIKSHGGIYTKTLTTGVNTFTFSNLLAGETIVVRVLSAATGTIVWPTVKWSGGATSPVQTIGTKTDIYTFIYDGTDVFGSVVQNF